MTTVSCIQPSLLLQRRISCVREMGKTTKINGSVTYCQCGHCDFTLSLALLVPPKPPSCVFLWVNYAWFCRCYWHVIAKSPCWWPPVTRVTCMNVLTCIIFKVSLAVNLSSASISADSSDRHGWKKKKTWITNTKVSLPKMYFQTRQHWLMQRKLRWSKVFTSPKYRIHSKKPRGAYEIFGLVDKRPISGRWEWG